MALTRKEKEIFTLRKQRDRHRGEWITQEIVEQYQQKASVLGNDSLEDIGVKRALRIELQEKYDLLEIEAINLLNGYHVKDILRKYERIKNIIPLDVKYEKVYKTSDEEDEDVIEYNEVMYHKGNAEYPDMDRKIKEFLRDSSASGYEDICFMPNASGDVCGFNGVSMTLTNRICPNFLGKDVGCGIDAYKLKCKSLDLEKLDAVLHEHVPIVNGRRNCPIKKMDNLRLQELSFNFYFEENEILREIGTLGKGNHFIELGKDKNGCYWLFVHAGSRALGNAFLEYYTEKAVRECPEKTRVGQAFLIDEAMAQCINDLEIVQRFAAENRKLIAEKIIGEMQFEVIDQISSVHTTVDLQCDMMRKGCVSAKKGERLLIPLNMRDGILICEGKGNESWNESAPGGLKRIVSEAEAKKIPVASYRDALSGVFTTTIDWQDRLHYPDVYAPVREFMNTINETVEIKEWVKPVYNYRYMAKE